MTTIEAKPTPRVPHWLIRTIWSVASSSLRQSVGRMMQV